MADYLSLDPAHPGFGSSDEPDMQLIHNYRMLVAWLAAALIEHGRIHITRESLDAVIAHLDACAEKPTFAFDRFSDGCEDIWLDGYRRPSPLNN